VKLERLLAPKDLAQILNVKVGTIYSWLSRGISLPPYIRIAGSTRWREKTVQNWIEKKEREKKKRNFEL
jgi:predicted DNA-binding transcriptional regulator AlpA